MIQLLQIREPGAIDTDQHPARVAIGIDLGTTNSLVAIYDQDKPRIIADKNGEGILPSVVSYLDGRIKVGHSALVDFHKTPEKVYRSTKRLLGQIVTFENDATSPKPIDISAEILKRLKQIAEEDLGQEVGDAVITVPAYFDEAARSATKIAAQIAGLNVLRLLNEPTAAALAYGLDTGHEGVYAIYDLGGGTFDISLLKLTKGVFQVIATGGDTTLGGDDIDQLIVDQYFIDRPSHQTLDLIAAQKIKEELSLKKTVPLPHGKSLSQEDLSTLCEPLIAKTLHICKDVLIDAGLTSQDIKGVVLVGGSTRMPYLRNRVESFFGQKPYTDIDPDCTVAIGAAIQARALSKGSDTLLLDVTALSLGIETMGGLMEKIIHRNSPIPISKTQEFTTSQDGQTAIVINVVQGEREMVADNRSLARFELHDIPAKTAGAARIKVTFTLDADGLLTVSAKEVTQGKTQQIHVKPSYGLNVDELTERLRSSYIHAESDMQERFLAQAIVDAQRLIACIVAALEQDHDLLDPQNVQEIENKIVNLREKIASKDKDAIQHFSEELNRFVQEFAELRMNKAISQALQGKKIEQIL